MAHFIEGTGLGGVGRDLSSKDGAVSLAGDAVEIFVSEDGKVSEVSKDDSEEAEQFDDASKLCSSCTKSVTLDCVSSLIPISCLFRDVRRHLLFNHY